MRNALKAALILRDQQPLVDLIEKLEKTRGSKERFDSVLMDNPLVLCDDADLRQEIIDYLKTLGVSVEYINKGLSK
ncbi:MAG: hypothetical protein ACYS8Z_00375 [Planctomycetota bacterium]|jgi:hypothetical protein